MLLYAENEERRSRLFHVVFATSTLLIVLVVAYFIMRIFTGNPLTGKWASLDSDIVLDIKESGKAYITVSLSEGEMENIDLAYSADLEEKTITFMDADTEYLRELDANEDTLEEDAQYYIWAEVSPYISTFQYSVESNELILSDTEFGEQMVLKKAK